MSASLLSLPNEPTRTTHNPLVLRNPCVRRDPAPFPRVLNPLARPFSRARLRRHSFPPPTPPAQLGGSIFPDLRGPLDVQTCLSVVSGSVPRLPPTHPSIPRMFSHLTFLLVVRAAGVFPVFSIRIPHVPGYSVTKFPGILRLPRGTKPATSPRVDMWCMTLLVTPLSCTSWPRVRYKSSAGLTKSSKLCSPSLSHAYLLVQCLSKNCFRALDPLYRSRCTVLGLVPWTAQVPPPCALRLPLNGRIALLPDMFRCLRR